MRNEIRSANADYRTKVDAANMVRDEEVAKAKAQRNKPVDAARSGGGKQLKSCTATRNRYFGRAFPLRHRTE